jgi:hypothetical protein
LLRAFDPFANEKSKNQPSQQKTPNDRPPRPSGSRGGKITQGSILIAKTNNNAQRSVIGDRKTRANDVQRLPVNGSPDVANYPAAQAFPKSAQKIYAACRVRRYKRNSQSGQWRAIPSCGLGMSISLEAPIDN